MDIFKHFGNNWAIAPFAFERLFSSFKSADNGQHLLADLSSLPVPYIMSGDTGRFMAAHHDDEEKSPVEETDEGSILFIPIKGVVVRDASPLMQAYFGLSSMSYTGNLIRHFSKMDSIKGIVLEMNTPGGTVDGTKELVDTIVAASKMKPIVALVENATSAGQWISSACSYSIASSVLDNVGSIGVMTSHLDSSVFYENSGFKLTYLSADKSIYKLIGRADKALTDDDISHITSELNDILKVFERDIRRFRPGVDSEVFTAKVYTAKDGLKVGLLDQVARKGNALDLAVSRINILSKKLNAMSTNAISAITEDKTNLPNINNLKTENMEFTPNSGQGLSVEPVEKSSLEDSMNQEALVENTEVQSSEETKTEFENLKGKGLNVIEADLTAASVLLDSINSEGGDKYAIVSLDELVSLENAATPIKDDERQKLEEYAGQLIESAKYVEMVETQNEEMKVSIDRLSVENNELVASLEDSKSELEKIETELSAEKEKHSETASLRDEYYNMADSAGLFTPKAQDIVDEELNVTPEPQETPAEKVKGVAQGSDINWAVGFWKDRNQSK